MILNNNEDCEVIITNSPGIKIRQSANDNTKITVDGKLIKPKTRDFQETVVNMISGLVINFGLTLLMFDKTPTYVAGATAVFFVCSFTRSYLVRKIYRKLETE